MLACGKYRVDPEGSVQNPCSTACIKHVLELPGTPDLFQAANTQFYADPLGKLTLRETVLVEGAGAQNVMRWEDYTQTAIDPSDDCTVWYVGDYIKQGETSYSSRIGAFRMPGCKGNLRGTILAKISTMSAVERPLLK